MLRKGQKKKDVAEASSKAFSEGDASAAPAHFFNGRLIIAVCLLLLIAFIFTTPLTNYFSQRTEISRQEEVVRQQREENRNLLELRERQGDEEYVKQQARQRLRMAIPGETPYIVVGQIPDDDRHAVTSFGGAKNASQNSWTQRVLESIEKSAQHQRFPEGKEK